MGTIPVAFVLASLTSRWGTDLFAKPSMPLRVLVTAVVTLVTLGFVVGLVRAWWRMPQRLAAPLSFAFGLWLSMLTWLFTVGAILLALASEEAASEQAAALLEEIEARRKAMTASPSGAEAG